MHSEQDQKSNHCHQRLDWTWSKTNWACSEFRAGFWTKTVALWPTLHQLLQTSFQSAGQCDMAAKSDRNGPYLKKGYQMLLHEVWVILVFFKPQKNKNIWNKALLWALSSANPTEISFYITIKWKGKGRQSYSSSLYSKKQWAQTFASCYRDIVNSI